MKLSKATVLTLVALVTTGALCGCNKNDGLDENAKIEFAPTSDNLPVFFDYGESKILALDVESIDAIDGMEAPDGWSVEIVRDNGLITAAKVTAPKADDEDIDTDGEIELSVANILKTSIKVYTADYTDPYGALVVLEDFNKGALSYIDRYGRQHDNVFAAANPEITMGGSLQDLYIKDDKIYLLAQNAASDGSRLFVCNPRTMKAEAKSALDFKSADGASVWTQHIVVADNGKAYIQYSTTPYETYSGIRSIELASMTVAPDDIPDTYGTMTAYGATKARMTYSRGKIYAARGNSVAVIEPETDRTTLIPFADRCVKDVTKGADGNIYVLTTGIIKDGKVTTPAVIWSVSQSTGSATQMASLGDIVVSELSYCPNNSMSASFTSSKIFFISGTFGDNELCSFDYATKEVRSDVSQAPDGLLPYGYPAFHPETGTAYVGYTDYVKTEVVRYSDPETSFVLPTGPVAGIFFPYMFSDDWTAR
ncbi:MAG: DUF5074 domain-containing protein [Rikenellaceae bacterium]|nr:DUF5074 domain-containing protein [Rikenellaceae bacterium]